MSSIPFFIGMNNERRRNERIRRRATFLMKRKLLRDVSDPLSISEERFQELFRVPRELFKYLLDEIQPHLKPARRITKLPSHLKVLAALRFYATGCYQRSIGSDFFIAMSQTSISRIVEEITGIIEKHVCIKWIKFPTENDFHDVKRQFYENVGFPGVIGAIDGTHVIISQPVADEHLYLNRKGLHSINTQIICDYKLNILAVNSRHPGATHDSAIWSLCKEKIYLQRIWRREAPFYLLDDSGYPLEPWLMTPFRSANEGTKEWSFNKQHIRSRNCVERCIGVLKGRFRCLNQERTLKYEPKKASRIINVCCALHNMCLRYNVNENEVQNVDENELTEENIRYNENTVCRQQAELLRNSLAETFHNRSH